LHADYTLIDVAGLVPGAYQGKGKGNQFLADLCTADALVHVVDASGLTDRGGNLTDLAFDEVGNQDGAGNKLPTTGEAAAAAVGAAAVVGAAAAGDGAEIVDEMGWVPREIHLWVMTNLKAKMATWRKRPQVIASDGH
jgi:ribosome-binding ATPase YchF (GTP1/OBG family)